MADMRRQIEQKLAEVELMKAEMKQQLTRLQRQDFNTCKEFADVKKAFASLAGRQEYVESKI